MSYTARKLITNAYYLSRKVARNFQTVPGDDINYGLELLNDVLAVKTIDKRLIPFFQEIDVTLVPNQEIYFVENLVHIETATFNIGNVRFEMNQINRRKYFGDSRVDGITSLPFTWHMERCLNGSNLYLYFLPNANYELKIWGKLSLSAVNSLDQDLSLTIEANYLVYLKYALAHYICMSNGLPFPAEVAKEYERLERLVTDISPYDLTMKKLSTLTSYGGSGDIWIQANLQRGWDV